LKIVDFSANIPEQAEAAQMLFMKAMVFPAPPEQVVVVALPTDLCTPVQYDGIVATMAAEKGKHCEVPPINNDSNYGELQFKEEEEEEGKTPTQCLQCIQQNKKITKKKANKAKAAAALMHQAQNNFSGHIPNGLRVKIWRLLNVKQLNLFFHEAIGPCCYYLYQTNTVFVSAKANQVATFKFSSGQQAKIPSTMVYKFAHHGFSSMLFKLEQLHKYYMNPHILCHNYVIAYMLLTELQEFAWKCDVFAGPYNEIVV
ncbi:hypothetical protein C0993_011630, partial [Termitomyces sp. T159_Od127]